MPCLIVILLGMTTTYCKDSEHSDLSIEPGMNCAFINQIYKMIDFPDVTQMDDRKSRQDFSALTLSV